MHHQSPEVHEHRPRAPQKPLPIEVHVMNGRDLDRSGDFSRAADEWEKVIELAVRELNANLRQIGSREVVKIMREMPVSLGAAGAAAEHGRSGRSQAASDGKVDYAGNVIERPVCKCGAEMQWDGDTSAYFCAAFTDGAAREASR